MNKEEKDEQKKKMNLSELLVFNFLNFENHMKTAFQAFHTSRTTLYTDYDD